MASSKLGRRVFECLTCHEIIQFLEVIEVPDSLPWSETHRVNCRDRSSDEPIQEKQRSRTTQIIRVQSMMVLNWGSAYVFDCVNRHRPFH
jgi:hypothetical protein